MNSALRLLAGSLPRAAAGVAWLAALALLGLGLFFVARSCGYDLAAPAIYAIYFALHVALPGIVTLHWVNRRPLSLTTILALALPTGYAVEIFSFLGCAALGAKAWLPYFPLGWTVLAALLCLRRGVSPVQCRLTYRHAGVALALSALFFATVGTAACQMFSESPLIAGLPQRPIFHDWVYLVSRAASIKQHWPLEDPSLVGTSLQYHYFMMVHAASASWCTKLELTMVILRLMTVPLGAVLVAQAFALGRHLSRSAWGGVVSAVLTVVSSEVSFAPHYSEPEFLGLFNRWLYVSPTFFFGMIFFGALLLAVVRCFELPRLTWRHLAWLVLLAAAGTGAKGTVLPVLLMALALWALWEWGRDRQVPVRRILMGLGMGAAFAVVYHEAMASCGSGEATFEPFRVFQLSHFWQGHFAHWQHFLSAWLSPTGATHLAGFGCALVVFAGTAGVRLLAIPYLLQNGSGRHPSAAAWLGAVFVASSVTGILLHLDSYGELYIVLLMRLPMAVLAAAFMVDAIRRFAAWWRAQRGEVVVTGESWAASWRKLRSVVYRPGGLAFATFATAAVLLTLGVQTGLALRRNQAGFLAWLRIPPHHKADDDMLHLHEAMLWVRENTESNAILMANAFTPTNAAKQGGNAVDHTTAGVHYYYSALSERRLWVEGPRYLLDTRRARNRMDRAAEIFYGGRAPVAFTPGPAPCYLLLDRGAGDGASVFLPESARVFANTRIEIYRVPPQSTGVEIAAADGGSL